MALNPCVKPRLLDRAALTGMAEWKRFKRVDFSPKISPGCQGKRKPAPIASYIVKNTIGRSNQIDKGRGLRFIPVLKPYPVNQGSFVDDGV